jgi:hypothetical protein
LSKLRAGFLVDYDLKTWEVASYNRFDFGDGYVVDAWELVSGRDKYFLERSVDEDEEYSLSKKVPIGKLGANVRSEIMENDDPPEQLKYDDKTYYLDESVGGHMYPDGKGPSQELLKWEFVDDDDETFLSIEQWSETEIEASHGFYVKEHQFSNILPKHA